MKARPYQDAARAAVRDAWAAKDGHPLVVMATGTGKTETALGLVVEAIDAGERVVWLAHREELVRAPVERLSRYRPDLARHCGVEQADSRPHMGARFVAASIPTLAASPERASRYLDAALVVVDEAHHSTSATWRAVMDLWPSARRLGLTATPERADRADLSDLWVIAYAYGIADAIEGGYLVPPFAALDQLPGLDLGAIGGRHDYDDAVLGAALMAAHVVEHTVAAMGRPHTASRLPDRDEARVLSAEGRSTIVYTATVEQAEATAVALRDAGWTARMLCGTTPRDERAALLRAFTRGDVRCLVNPVVLTEGTDLPIASCLVLARPTRSWGLYVQMVGRGLRLAEGKAECLVLDVGGATGAHSLVSAPVLVGSTVCSRAGDGLHRMEPAKDGPGGVCAVCGRKVACLVGALAGGTGSHTWRTDRPTCRLCDAAQCTSAPSQWHDWIPMVRGDPPRIVHECGYCPATWTDQVSGLQAGTRPYVRESVNPQRIGAAGISTNPEAWGRSLGDLGHVIYIGDRVADRWVPWYFPGPAARRAKRAKLAAAPVSGLRCRQILDDMARRATETPTMDEHQLSAWATRLSDLGLVAIIGAPYVAQSTPRQREAIVRALEAKGHPPTARWVDLALPPNVAQASLNVGVVEWATTSGRAWVAMQLLGGANV